MSAARQIAPRRVAHRCVCVFVREWLSFLRFCSMINIFCYLLSSHSFSFIRLRVSTHLLSLSFFLTLILCYTFENASLLKILIERIAFNGLYILEKEDLPLIWYTDTHRSLITNNTKKCQILLLLENFRFCHLVSHFIFERNDALQIKKAPVWCAKMCGFGMA